MNPPVTTKIVLILVMIATIHVRTTTCKPFDSHPEHLASCSACVTEYDECTMKANDSDSIHESIRKEADCLKENFKCQRELCGRTVKEATHQQKRIRRKFRNFLLNVNKVIKKS